VVKIINFNCPKVQLLNYFEGFFGLAVIEQDY